MIWWYLISHLLIHIHTSHSMFGQIEQTEKKMCTDKSRLSTIHTHLISMNEHAFTISTHTLLSGRYTQCRRGDERDWVGVYLLTALYHCVTDHTSEGCRWNKGLQISVGAAMMMDDNTENLLIITLTSHAWFSACRWTPSDPSCCSSPCPSWQCYHSLQVNTKTEKWMQHLDKQYLPECSI